MTCKSWNLISFFFFHFILLFFLLNFLCILWVGTLARRLLLEGSPTMLTCVFIESVFSYWDESNIIPDYTNCNARQSNWVSTIKVIIKLSQKMLYGRTFQTFWCVIFCRLYVLYGFAILWKLTCFSPLSLIYKRSRKWVTNETPLT
jgi:hypothetical protein